MYYSFEDYVPHFCRLCANYAHHFFGFVLHILENVGFKFKKKLAKLIHTGSNMLQHVE